ncbi:MAG: ThiS family protein [Candidatus Aminicenantes bacterium]|nr:MAG: ThiS family protein [Candidatus Aminicenantes bacterium]
MSVKVKIHQTLRHLTNGQGTVEVSGNTVGECLYDLVKQFPGIKPKIFDNKGKLLNYVDIYVNLESSYPEELAMSVKDGDRLHITIIIGGG